MNAAKVVLSELAAADILEQADWYEARSDWKLAKRWEKSVTSTLLLISRMPNSGVLCRFKADRLLGVRRVPISGFSKYLIFYKLEKGIVWVLRVMHGARDLESLLSG